MFQKQTGGPFCQPVRQIPYHCYSDFSDEHLSVVQLFFIPVGLLRVIRTPRLADDIHADLTGILEFLLDAAGNFLRHDLGALV